MQKKLANIASQVKIIQNIEETEILDLYVCVLSLFCSKLSTKQRYI